MKHLIIVLMLLAVIGCSGTVTPEDEVEAHFESLMDAMNDHDLQVVTSHYTGITDQEDFDREIVDGFMLEWSIENIDIRVAGEEAEADVLLRGESLMSDWFTLVDADMTLKRTSKGWKIVYQDGL